MAAHVRRPRLDYDSLLAVNGLRVSEAVAIDLTVGERCQGPIFLTAAGTRLDRHAAGRIVRRITL